jgi:hypothetical protein
VPKICIKLFRNFPGSSSSSNSYNDDRYASSKSEDRSHSRRPVDERDKRRQKSRWDDDRSSGRNGGDKEYKRNRSRSPVQDKPIEIEPPKKVSNWSDSSSEDEDTRKVKKDRVNGQEEHFHKVEEFKIGSAAGLDLGYQREDIQLLLPLPEVRSNNNNDNNWKLDSHSSYQHKGVPFPVPPPPPPTTKSTTPTVGIQMKLLPSVTVLTNQINRSIKLLINYVQSFRNLPRNQILSNQNP